LNCEDYLYNKTARRIADVYKRVAKGGHPPGELNRLLDKIANEQDRNSIFFELRKRKAEGALKKQTQILKLFQQAKKLDDENNSLKALTVLDELHQLAPLHEEAFDLKREISVRYLGQVKTNSVGMRLVWIPTGEFLMGTPWEKGGSANERPVHRVRISQGFWMGMYEVTQRQYKEVMGKNPSHFKGDDFPAEMVSWDDAIKFCRKLGQKEGKKYRLPTEAEWEYACRAGTTTLYSWGDTQHLGLCNAENSTVKVGSGNIYDRNVAVFKKRGFPVDSTVPVGSFEANAFGLYDMHGNVREWCQDSFAFDFYENSPSFQLDPQGPDQNTTRVCRGGSWRWHLYSSRSAYRTFNKHSSKLDDQGFRVVLEGRIP
jgi:formylglycine-generating enzyme required for sulfatase activity